VQKRKVFRTGYINYAQHGGCELVVGIRKLTMSIFRLIRNGMMVAGLAMGLGLAQSASTVRRTKGDGWFRSDQ
jgi:hypothetical protein